MKRIALFLVVMVFSVAVMADPVAKQIRISAGDATNPQTFSFKTLYGVYAKTWTCIAPDGGATFKFHSYGGSTAWHLYLPSGTSFTMSNVEFPIDSLIILRDATSSSAYFVGVGE